MNAYSLFILLGSWLPHGGLFTPWLTDLSTIESRCGIIIVIYLVAILLAYYHLREVHEKKSTGRARVSLESYPRSRESVTSLSS